MDTTPEEYWLEYEQPTDAELEDIIRGMGE
jgi:hypothetical protein